jgi:hypothetical protein
MKYVFFHYLSRLIVALPSTSSANKSRGGRRPPWQCSLAYAELFMAVAVLVHVMSGTMYLGRHRHLPNSAH